MKQSLALILALLGGCGATPVEEKSEPAADGSSMPIVARHAAADGGWDYAALGADEGRLYVGREDGILAMDLATGKITEAFVSAEGIAAVIPVPGSNRGIATSPGSNEALVFSRNDGSIIARLKVGREPDGATFDAERRLVYVVNHAGGSVSIVDPVSAKVLREIEVGGLLEGATAGSNGILYISAEDRNDIAVVDTIKGQVSRRIPLPGCVEPKGIAMDRERKLVIVGCVNETAKIVDPSNDSIIATAPIGKWSDGIIYDSTRKRFFSTNWDGSVSVIDLSDAAAPKPLPPLRTQQGMRTGALDEAAGRLYVVGAEEKVKPGTEDTTIVPGTFKILAFDVAEK